ncbi:ABC transporter permease [Egibacter rhizosphaerae]|uniref:ABC transporter permease n=1 Tax=Egibacter rhizosphaerae TaxID=1670831 RepID=UPI0013F16E35|nr:ABC transporter permease [Egibacter rhizosphaerae]
MSENTTSETSAEAPKPLQPPRRIPKLRHLQTLGTAFLVLGVLVVWASTALEDEPITMAIGVGEAAPRFDVTPDLTVLVIGLVMTIAGLVALADRWTGRYAAVGLLVSAILLLPLLVVLSVGLSGAPQTNILTLAAEALRRGTPIALGALAGLWCERSGVINIGIEGMMLAGAGIGFLSYTMVFGGVPGLGLVGAVLVAVLTGGLMAALHAMLCVTFKTDQIVSGVVINLLALGLTSFLRREILLPADATSAPTLPQIDLLVLSDLPVVGPLFSGRPIFFTMFLAVLVTHIVLFRSRWGLRVRSVGEKPHAAETAGLNVVKLRYQAVIVGGLLAGLGGAWFSLETVGGFDDGMTQGNGFIALAAMIFGKWRPWSAFGGAMLFGLASSIGTRIQLLGVEVGDFPIPPQFMQAFPYVVTIIVLAGAIGRAVPPAAIGQPYEPSR